MAEKKFDPAILAELQLIEKIIYKKALEISRLRKNEELQKLKLQFSSMNEAFELMLKEFNLLEHDRKKLEDTIKLQDEKIKKINEKLFSGTITSSKELVNYQDEIKLLSQSNDNLEDKELGLMMDIDEKRPKLKEHEGLKKALEEKIQALDQDIERAIKDIEGGIIVLKKKREEAIRKIPAEIFKKYDELKKKKGGIAVAIMKDNFCDICSVQLPAGELQNIKDPDKIHKCPMCGRMLIINSDGIEEVKKLYESM